METLQVANGVSVTQDDDRYSFARIRYYRYVSYAGEYMPFRQLLSAETLAVMVRPGLAQN